MSEVSLSAPGSTLNYIDPRIVYILSGYNYEIFINIYAPFIVENYLGDIQHQNNLRVFIKSKRYLTYISPYINKDITLLESKGKHIYIMQCVQDKNLLSKSYILISINR